MEHTIQVLIERLVRFRKQLAELEKQRAQSGSEVPHEIWEEFVQVSRNLDREERKAEAACRRKSKQINETRQDIIATVEEYNNWREQMREVEQLFLSTIVRPGYRLKQAVRQREFLEGEYRRIRRGVEIESYASLEELETDIRRVLTQGESGFEADQESYEDEVLQEKRQFKIPQDIDIDEWVDEFEKDTLLSEFKQVVLPAVHPDTSDTPAEIFTNVFEVYENRDYILIEAYTIQYKGDIVLDLEEDQVVFLEESCAYQDRCDRLLGKLTRRVEHLRKDLTPQELENPNSLRDEFQQQRDEIHERTQNESEQILRLRDKIEGLAQLYLDRQSVGEGSE